MSKFKPAATMKQVAQTAGVSTATVSRALSKPEKLSSRTRLRVEEAVVSCGYSLQPQTPSPESRIVLVVLQTPDDPIGNEIVKSVKRAASTHDYIILISYDDPRLRERYPLHYLTFSRQICGVIQIGAASYSNWLRRYGLDALPQVNVGRGDYSPSSVSIDIDRLAAAFSAVDYLCRLGYSRIAYVGETDDKNSGDRHFQGYQQALTRWKIAPEPHYVIYGESAFSYGSRAAERLIALPTPPNAIYCSNDVIAVGAIHRLKRASLTVPHQLSVIGFGDSEPGWFYDPPLTTVKYPAEEIGKRAFNTLLEWLQRPDLKPKALLMESEIVQRETTIARRH